MENKNLYINSTYEQEVGIQEVRALTIKDLAKRWQVTPPTIDNYIKDGILTRMPIPSVRFSLDEIEKLEGVEPNPLSPLERKRFEVENQKLKEEIILLRETVREIYSKINKFI